MEVILCLMMLILYAMTEGHYADFFPINGTFQNYNPVRRLFSGQIPYMDFYDYLGLGHLYVGSLATALFGGTYLSSISAFSFLSVASFALMAYVISCSVYRDRLLAISLTNLILFLMLFKPLVFTNGMVGMGEIASALNYVINTGNSARLMRAMVLPLSVLLWEFGYRMLLRRYDRKSWLYSSLSGVIAGLSFPWSNDYGICCWFSILLMVFLVNLSMNKKILSAAKHLLLAAITSVLTMAVTVEVLTLGHFENWLRETFGTGGYQSWYFNQDKSYYIWDIDTSFISVLQIAICIYYLVRFFHEKEGGQLTAKNKNVGLAYMNMVCICATQEYRLIGGGNNTEAARCVLWLTLICEIVHQWTIKRDKEKMKQQMVILSAVCVVCWFVSELKPEAFFRMSAKEGVPIEELGGNVTSLGEDLLRTESFLGEEKVFATYASAQEVISGTFQPSGRDYIIHVLGDRQRREYLNAFHNEDFRYVATIKSTFTDWEYWIQRANWFFYRELYNKWHPVFENEYELYWERNEEDNYSIHTGIQVETSLNEDGDIIVSVFCEEPVCGIADVFIDYEVQSKQSAISKFNILRLLKVQNTGAVSADNGSYYESNYLQDKSAEYIPVPIYKGSGAVTLTAEPGESAQLKLNECSCSTVFTQSPGYFENDKIKESIVD